MYREERDEMGLGKLSGLSEAQKETWAGVGGAVS